MLDLKSIPNHPVPGSPEGLLTIESILKYYKDQSGEDLLLNEILTGVFYKPCYSNGGLEDCMDSECTSEGTHEVIIFGVYVLNLLKKPQAFQANKGFTISSVRIYTTRFYQVESTIEEGDEETNSHERMIHEYTLSNELLEEIEHHDN